MSIVSLCTETATQAKVFAILYRIVHYLLSIYSPQNVHLVKKIRDTGPKWQNNIGKILEVHNYFMNLNVFKHNINHSSWKSLQCFEVMTKLKRKRRRSYYFSLSCLAYYVATQIMPNQTQTHCLYHFPVYRASYNCHQKMLLV